MCRRIESPPRCCWTQILLVSLGSLDKTHHTLYPATLPGGGSQLKRIFLEFRACAFGLRGAPSLFLDVTGIWPRPVMDATPSTVSADREKENDLSFSASFSEDIGSWLHSSILQVWMPQLTLSWQPHLFTSAGTRAQHWIEIARCDWTSGNMVSLVTSTEQRYWWALRLNLGLNLCGSYRKDVCTWEMKDTSTVQWLDCQTRNWEPDLNLHYAMEVCLDTLGLLHILNLTYLTLLWRWKEKRRTI